MTSQCKKCGKSLVSTRAGSFTSYLFQQNYCQCNKVKALHQSKARSTSSSNSSKSSNPKATTASQVCTNCGKSVAKKRAGSFTSFLFQELRCQCAQPALPKDARLARTNTQTRRQAMTEKRGYTANLKANAESARKLPQADFSVGTVIGGVFSIISEIGEGGMGIVYLAQHLSLNRHYALKILSPSIVSEQSWLRFKAEAKTLSLLSHPGLVKVYDLGIHENTVPYYSMDYLEGETLEDLLVREGPQELETTIPIFLAVLDALAYAHRNNVVHRDIKPANIFICQNKEIKILDFGISKLVGDKHNPRNQELTAVGEVFGSPYYMSPEQCRGEQIDFRSDIYSVGCTLFETLTGYVPFESDSSLEIAMLHEEGDVPLFAEVCDIDLPVSLNVVIEKCLAKLPEDRYQSAKEMAIDLMRIKEGKNLAAYAVASKGFSGNFVKTDRESKGLSLAPVLIAGLVLFLAGTVAYFLNGSTLIVPAEKQAERGGSGNVADGKSNHEHSESLRNKSFEYLEFSSASERPLYVGDVMNDVAKKGSSVGAETKKFLGKPFKYFSQVLTDKDGHKIKRFEFPPGLSLGSIRCRTSNNTSTKANTSTSKYEAKGTISLPANCKVALNGNATLQIYPELLTYFRSNDLTSLALSSEWTRSDLMLSNIAKLTSLETLSVQNLIFNASSFSCLSRLTNLESVGLYFCAIDPKSVADWRSITKLKSLVLKGSTNFSGILQVLAKKPNLTSLVVTFSTLSRDDLKAIAAINTLETLSLNGSSVNNDDLKILTALNNLRDLDLDATKVDNDCIDTLLKFQKLERLVIQGLSVSDEKRLKSALPRLRALE